MAATSRTLVAELATLQFNTTSDWTQLAPDPNVSLVLNGTSDVASPSGLDSLVNILVALVLALMILATAIGKSLLKSVLFQLRVSCFIIES